jgi:hypothetical protein
VLTRFSLENQRNEDNFSIEEFELKEEYLEFEISKIENEIKGIDKEIEFTKKLSVKFYFMTGNGRRRVYKI